MRRTTIRLDDDLLTQAKQVAAEDHRSLTSVIEDALRLLLSTRQKARAGKPIRLKTFKGRGLRPGVQIDNTSSLLDWMDEHDSD